VKKKAVEANPSLLRHHAAAVILARQAAIKAVRQQRKRQGIKGTLPYSTLARLGREWLAAHSEMIAEAALSPIVQNLQLTHSRRRPDPKRELVCRSQVQNGGQQ
jgi:hypothetical protein